MNKQLHMVAYVLLWVGGLNWGLIGLLRWNLVESLGLPSMVTQLVYVLVGVSAVYLFATHMGYCTMCATAMPAKKKKK